MSSDPTDAVVTGGAGAIGSRLVEGLLAEGLERVVVVDDMSSGHRWLVPSDPRVTVVVGDVCELPQLGIDVEDAWVFHLAAFFANQNSVDHPFEDLRRNGLGTLTALAWAQTGRARRLVYASAGCSMAGHDVEGPISEDLPVSLDLATPYQITKALGEYYCNYFRDSLSTVRCRFFNSYGPGEVPGLYRNVIPNFVWSAMNGEPLVVTGTGRETRDFIYVGDLVGGLIRAARMPRAHGMAFNLGTGIQTRIDRLVELVIEACGSRSAVEHGPRRPWDHSVHREADISRAHDVLGFEPSVPIEVGLRRTVDWFVQHTSEIAESAAGAR